MRKAFCAVLRSCAPLPQVEGVWKGLRFFKRDGGATLAEFAFTLPLLAVILYAIFDFGSALTLKQKLEQVTYEAARLAASQSTDDFSNPTVSSTGSIADLRDAVARNLQAAGVNDCGLLGAASTAPSPATSTWGYSVSGGGCPAPLVLTIRRQNVIAVNGIDVFTSRISLQYPFQYHLAPVLQLFTPGSTFPSSANLVVNATMKNLI
jgi:Flp pilus assembly protein TadG